MPKTSYVKIWQGSNVRVIKNPKYCFEPSGMQKLVVSWEDDDKVLHILQVIGSFMYEKWETDNSHMEAPKIEIKGGEVLANA